MWNLILANIKWLIIGLITLAAAYFMYDYISMSKEISSLTTQVEIQQKTIESKNKEIKIMENLNETAEAAIHNRDLKIKELNDKFDGLTADLGPDIDKDAPESLKELFRRLNK